MAICPKCGKELEDGITKCPTCDIGENTVQNTIEEVQVDPNNVISLEEVKNEEVVSNEKTSESISVKENTQPQPEETKEEPLPVNNIVEEVTAVEETNIVNENLETVSVDATNISLEADPPQQAILGTPEMPEPTIGELSSEILGKVYDEAERINNEKIEAKRRQELAELERLRQEEEAKRQAQAQAGRPDLLAGRTNGEINIDTMPKKNKTSKILIIFLVILILLAIAGGLYYFLVVRNQ